MSHFHFIPRKPSVSCNMYWYLAWLLAFKSPFIFLMFLKADDVKKLSNEHWIFYYIKICAIREENVSPVTILFLMIHTVLWYKYLGNTLLSILRWEIAELVHNTNEKETENCPKPSNHIFLLTAKLIRWFMDLYFHLKNRASGNRWLLRKSCFPFRIWTLGSCSGPSRWEQYQLDFLLGCYQ